jgi:ATP phosphoribosyltransferase
MTALNVAIPSKGRLQEQALAFLADAGLHVTQSRGARDYVAAFKGFDNITVSLLSAAEIADELSAGRIHLGVSGEDLLREHALGEDRTHVVEKLGFGRANVVVAVPRVWIDVSTMADLDDVASAFHLAHHRRLRVATKYVNLTRAFFARHGVAGYRIVESLGATEGAPAAGTAEAIVDITTTGATLAANELKILDDGLILESQAVLAASLRATWGDGARIAARAVLERIAARAVAKSAQIIRVRMDQGVEAALPALERNLGAKILARPAVGNAAGEASILVPDANLTAAIALLRGTGAQGTVSSQKADYVFTPENALFARLQAKLTAAAG